MTKTENATTILGLAVAGAVVTIVHAGHPLDGESVTVESVNPNRTGGCGGGGDVTVRRSDGSTGHLSRYTRIAA